MLEKLTDKPLRVLFHQSFKGSWIHQTPNFVFWCYKDAQGKGLVQSQPVVVAGLSYGPGGHGL